VLAYGTRIQHYALKLKKPTLCVYCMVLLYRKVTVFIPLKLIGRHVIHESSLHKVEWSHILISLYKVKVTSSCFGAL